MNTESKDAGATHLTDERLAELEAAVASLAGRVSELERGRGPRPKPATEAAEELDLDLGMLQRLEERCSGPRYALGEARGAVAYGGTVRFGDRRYAWIQEQPLPQLLAGEAGPLAGAIGALGSPARLHLLRSLLQGPRTRQELQEVLGTNSPGQLYHHLRELQAAGAVHQPRRGRYEIAPHKVVPLLVILAAAFALAEDRPESPVELDQIDTQEEGEP
jgi:DNA-binding transcriptional ArsR family regulator